MDAHILYLAFIIGPAAAISIIQRRRHLKIHAKRIAKGILIVWAMQGPFKNGEESAMAMRCADEAVRGPGALKNAVIEESVLKHAASYDEHPQEWESVREKALSNAGGQEFEKYLAIAKRLTVKPNSESETTVLH